MPLPADTKQPWPPKSWQPFAEDIDAADRWYSGRNLDGTNGAQVVTRNPRVSAWQRATNPITGRTYDKAPAGTTPLVERRLHVPAAADVASVGADLLFGTTPTLDIPAAHGDTPEPTAVATEMRLRELAQMDGWSSTLIEGAEISGALGGVFLRPVVDLDLVEHPILTVVHPDMAVPEFRHGRMVAVTFWQQFGGDNGDVWRHLERHQRGSVEHALYLGKIDQLGVRRPLSDRDETIGFANDVTAPYDGGLIDLVADGVGDRMLARYVPNALPNRRHRTQPVGRADTAGCEDLLAALDETWTSWVRDIRLAKARLIVPDEFLERTGRGEGATFDMDRELFSPLSMDPSHQDKAGITLVQFAIRVTEHAETCRSLFTQIVQTAGYSPQSFGLPGDGAQMTATEVDARTGRSDTTTARKREHWRRGLEDVAETMLWLDRVYCDGLVEPMRPTVGYPDASEADMRATANTLNLIGMAAAASTETKVKILNPEWTDIMVQAEVAKILAENGMPVDDPTGGLPV